MVEKQNRMTRFSKQIYCTISILHESVRTAHDKESRERKKEVKQAMKAWDKPNEYNDADYRER